MAITKSVLSYMQGHNALVLAFASNDMSEFYSQKQKSEFHYLNLPDR